MTTRPAYEEALIAHGTHAVRLRPTLRAASQLEAAFGLEALFRHVTEFDTRTIAAVITTAASDRGVAQALLFALADLPLRDMRQAALGPCLDLCAGLIPGAPQDDDTARSKPAPSDKPMSWGETYRQLFGLATGVLHWTPEAAWNATPTEIVIAIDAHLAHLKALHGSADDEDEDTASNEEQRAENEALGLDPDFDRAGLAALRARLADV